MQETVEQKLLAEQQRREKLLAERRTKQRLRMNERRGCGEFRVGPTRQKGLKHNYPKKRKSRVLRGSDFDTAKQMQDTLPGGAKSEYKCIPADEITLGHLTRVRVAKGSDHHSVQKPQKQIRIEKRLELLPADRKCGICNTVKIKSREWVAQKGFAVCLSCYRKAGKSRSACEVLLKQAKLNKKGEGEA